MVDDVDEQQDVETTTNTNTKINRNIEEDELELSLSLRPINSSFSLPSIKVNPQNLTKRDAQALRRHEAKLKRDLKRKTHQISLQNDALLLVANTNNVNHQQQRCPKVPNLGFQVAPPWLGWNAACFNGVVGFPSFQGQNCKFPNEEGNGNCNGNGNGNDFGSLSSGSSSGISDNHHSVSGAGANSSDAGSHSSYPHSQLPPSSVPSTSSQLPNCSSQLDLQLNDSDPNHSKPQLCSSYSNKIGLVSSSSKSPEGATTSSNMTCQQNEGSPTSDKDPHTTRSIIPKEGKGEAGKPPRPNGPKGQQKLLSSEMPCVSTTGNGPNGKTVTGFLYKYTKTEVSIICVCHGSSFSPAEFVEHAGGVDVEYPLRHIRVVPFALG